MDLVRLSGGPIITRSRVLFVLSVSFNFLVPWMLYRLSRLHVGETYAIMLSAAGPMVWSLVQLARSRKVDAMSVLVLSGIGLSLAVFALGGSPKVLLVRESLITGLGGLAFIGSAMMRRPLFYALVRAILKPQSAADTATARNFLSRARERIESQAEKPGFRRLMTGMSVASGVLLITEAAVRILLVFSLPTERVLLIGPIVSQGIIGLFVLSMFLYLYASKSSWEVEDDS